MAILIKTTVKIPIRTVSELNRSEHWTVKKNRHDQQKGLVRIFLNSHLTERIKFPLDIHIIRIAPRFLDAHDNLPASLKWIIDAIADWLIPFHPRGFADSSPLLHITVGQQKGEPKEYAVIVEITERDVEKYNYKNP